MIFFDTESKSKRMRGSWENGSVFSYKLTKESNFFCGGWGEGGRGASKHT